MRLSTTTTSTTTTTTTNTPLSHTAHSASAVSAAPPVDHHQAAGIRCDTMPNHVTSTSITRGSHPNPPNVGSPRKPPGSVATARSRVSTRAALIGTLCASPARPSHAIRQAQLFQTSPATCEPSPIQDEILGLPGGVSVDFYPRCRVGLPRHPDDSSVGRSTLARFPSDDSWSDDRLYKDAPRSARADQTYVKAWLQNQCPTPNVEEDLQANMSELALSPGSRRLPNSFIGDRSNLDAPVNRNVREYDGAVANFTLSKIQKALQTHPEHFAALPVGMDAQLSHQLPVSHPSRPSLPPRETYVSGGLFSMSTLQTPDDQGALRLPYHFKRASLPVGSQPEFVDSPSKRESKRPCRLSSNPQLTAPALSAIAAIHGRGSASSRTREEPLPSCALYTAGSDSSSLPSPYHVRSVFLPDKSPATPLMPPATPHLLPVSSSPLLHPSSPHFLRSALHGARAHTHAVTPHRMSSPSASSTCLSSPSQSPLAPRRRPADTAHRFSPTRHGLSPDVVLFRGDGAARAKLRERCMGRKRENSWGDESLFAGPGKGALGELGRTQAVNVDSGEEADEEDEGEGDADADAEDGGVPVPVPGCQFQG